MSLFTSMNYLDADETFRKWCVEFVQKNKLYGPEAEYPDKSEAQAIAGAAETLYKFVRSK